MWKLSFCHPGEGEWYFVVKTKKRAEELAIELKLDNDGYKRITDSKDDFTVEPRTFLITKVDEVYFGA